MNNNETTCVVSITATPAVLAFDYTALKTRLLKEMAEYDIEVTPNNIVEAKKKATDLNKLIAILDDTRKQKVAEVSAPIKDFEAHVKDLIEIVQDGRTKILNQVKVFEDKVRAAAKRELELLRDQQYDRLQIRPEYRAVEINHLVLISNVTDKLKLTKKTIDAVLSSAAACRNRQDKHDARCARLKSQSLALGLRLPLRPEDVTFLDDADDIFEQKLAERIKSELARQAAIEAEAQERERQRQERERQLVAEAQKLLNSSPVQDEVPEEEPEAPYIESKPAQTTKYSARVVEVTALFSVTLPEGHKSTPEQVAEAIKRKILSAGFTTLKSVSVKEVI